MKATKRTRSPVTGKFEWKAGRSVAIEVNTIGRMTERWLADIGRFLALAMDETTNAEWTKKRAREMRAQFDLLHPRR